MQDGSRNRPRSFAAERLYAGRHFVEHDAKTEEIASSVECFSPDLLRRHIGDRSHCKPGFGENAGLRIQCRREAL